MNKTLTRNIGDCDHSIVRDEPVKSSVSEAPAYYWYKSFASWDCFIFL